MLVRLTTIFLIAISMTSSVHAQALGPQDRMISIYFGGGSYYIDYDQRVELIDFMNEIEDLVGYQIEVHGHTDNIGSYSYNKQLSHLRCEAVKDILRELLIDEETIFQYDHGEENPEFSNETWEGKLHNRRVDVIIRRLAV